MPLQSAGQLQQTLRGVGVALGAEEQVARGAASVAAGVRGSSLSALQESQRKVALLEAMVTALRERLEAEEVTSSGLTEQVSWTRCTRPWPPHCVGVCLMLRRSCTSSGLAEQVS